MKIKYLKLIFLFMVISCTRKVPEIPKDNYLWLENLRSSESMEWVEKQNKTVYEKFAKKQQFKKNLLESKNIANSSDKIPKISVHGNYIYTLWKDKNSLRGHWKRSKIGKKYPSPRNWELVLDIDLLSRKDKKKWVLYDFTCLEPEAIHCLVSLSEGGGDTIVIREFNANSKEFTSNGFYIPKAKSWATWLNPSHILLETNYGPGTLTKAGHGKHLKIVKRNQQLSAPKPIISVPDTYLTVIPRSFYSESGVINFAIRHPSEMDNDTWIVGLNRAKKLPLPLGTVVHGIFKGDLIAYLRRPWEILEKKFKAGDLVSVKFDNLNDVNIKSVERIFENTNRQSIESVEVLKDFIAINVIKDVKGEIFLAKKNGSSFSFDRIGKDNPNQHLRLVDSHFEKNILFYQSEDFLSPPTLFSQALKSKNISIVKKQRKMFNSASMVIQQRWAQSKDGTRIPYFLVGKKSSIEKGNSAVLQYGYGGFAHSILPSYRPHLGKNWLEKGGLFALATIRGGSEFGPEWHQAAIQEKRQNAYDDFISVTEDLIQSKIAHSQRVGIWGASNGGLMVGAVMAQRPELYRAVVSYVPIMDMMRFSKLLTGSAWVGEYGNPDNSTDREFLLKYSPYHNIKPTVNYPAILMYSSTEDDRVHPAHARKMTAKLQASGKKDVYYYESLEGGHAGVSTNNQKAFWKTLMYEFLSQELMGK